MAKLSKEQTWKALKTPPFSDWQKKCNNCIHNRTHGRECTGCHSLAYAKFEPNELGFVWEWDGESFNE